MTLKEIAAELGVSYSTVSRVINNYNRNFSVRPELRQKILDKVEELHFQPNSEFSALRRKSNRQFAILLPFSVRGLGETGDSDSLYVIEKYLTAHHCHFEYLPFVNESELGFRLPKWHAAGFLAFDTITLDQLTGVEKSNIPYVVTNGICGENGTAVRHDDYEAVNVICDWLYKMKHWRIAYVQIALPRHDDYERDLYDFGVSHTVRNTPPAHHSTRLRINAFIDFCRGHAMPELCDQITSREELKECFDRYLAAGVTAIVGYNFKSGMIAMQELHNRGLEIPEDVSVIVFDDTDYNNYTIPTLSCFRLPSMEMGKHSAQLIIQRSKDSSYARGKTFYHLGRIIERDSVGPPRHAFTPRQKK